MTKTRPFANRQTADAARQGQRRKRADLAINRQILGWASVLVGLAVWEIAGRVFVQNTLFLATPTQAFAAIGRLWQKGELQHHAWISGQEFLIGFIAGSLAGIVIGLLMASFERVRSILGPWVAGIYATPVIAISPLLILWLGIGIWSKVAVVISLVIFPVIVNTEAGIRATDKQLIEVVRSFAASRLQIFVKVSLFAALPFILAGVRLAVGRGLIGVVVGELFGARAGIGFLITQSAESFDMPQLFAGIFILAAAGIVLTGAFRALQRRLVPWQ